MNRNTGGVYFSYEAHTQSPEMVTPVLMLHGFARNSMFWKAWVPPLLEVAPVLRIDQRGCGASPDPGEGHVFHTESMLADIVSVLDLLGVDRVHVIGESGGGMLGSYLAERFRAKVASLCLVSTPVRPARDTGPAKWAGYSSVEEAMERLGIRDWWLRSRGLGGELTGDDVFDTYWADQVARTPLHVALSFWHWIHSPEIDMREVLENVTAPTLIMSPGTSNGTTRELQNELAAAHENTRLIEYPDDHHEMYYVNPGKLINDYREFLQSV